MSGVLEGEGRLVHSESHNSSLVAASPIMSPRRCANQLISVHLPFGQHSKLEVRSGERVCDAIARCLLKRDIQPTLCHVSTSKDPKGPRFTTEMMQEDMYKVFLALEQKELWVHSEYLQTVSSIKHNFVRKTFIPQQACDVCKATIWLQGYRCEFCQFKFHQRCSSRAPLYCDLIAQVNRNEEMVARLRQVARDVGGENAAMAEDLLLTMNPTPIERDLTRKMAVRQRNTPAPIAATTEMGPYPRDRSSSAPNINAIVDDPSIELEHARIMKTLDIAAPLTKSVKGSIFKKTNYQRRAQGKGDHLNPCTISPSSSNSPSSTCSSPTSHSLHPPNLLANNLPLTPPQSAPPQKVSAAFFRGRSKSPGDRLDTLPRPRPSSNGKYEEWEVDEKQLVLQCKVGSGSFGTVYRADYFGTVAVKKLNVSEPTSAQLAAFKNEVAVLKKTRHLNVLMFMGWMREPLAIVTQWCEASSLFKHLHVVEPRVEFTLFSIVDILKQVALGMNYLHSKNIIHRDLKSNNIFLTHDNTIKIGDFGLATVKSRWSGSNQSLQPTGSILWMAPEVIRMKDANPYTTRSDVYSYGICMYEVLSGCLPYEHISSRDQILFMVGARLLRPDATNIRPDCPLLLRNLYEKCIEYDRDRRPEFSEVLDSLGEVSLPKLTRSTSEPLLFRRSSNETSLVVSSHFVPSAKML
ncbi:lin-45 [Pristionchus pacificus]|nr:lin-45 [Pristionchus pacificus]